MIASGEPIVIPRGVEQVDYESELAAVIGARVKGVSVENALEAVAGYTCLNDVTARDLQVRDGYCQRAKSFDKAKVRDEIEKTKGFIGTGGVVNMTPTDHLGLDLTAFRLLEIRNGDWTLAQ